MKITLGRNESCDYTVNSDSVSRTHAELVYQSRNKYLLKDTDSTNGTFVNSKRISSSAIKRGDKVTLGNTDINIDEVIDQLEKKNLSNKTDFTEEYNEMLVTFGEYQKKKDKISDPNVIRKVLMFIFLVLILLFILWIIFLSVDKIELETLRNLLFIGLALISAISFLLNSSQGKKSEKLSLLILEYEDKLVCPKCKYKFIKDNIAYWRNKTECRNTKCNAKFNQKTS